MTTNNTSSKKKFMLPIFIGLLALGGIIWGINSYMYSRSHEETDNAQLEGNISPIIPRVQGFITRIFIEDNQLVKKGDTLFTIDDRDLRNRVMQAEASFNNAVAALDVMRSNVNAAHANTEINNANTASSDAAIKNAAVRVWKANQDYTRYKNLLADNSATQQQFDGAKAEKDASESQLVVLQKQLQTTEKQTKASETQAATALKQVSVAVTSIEQRRAELEFARLQLSYTIVTAPSDGVVSKKSIQTGQFVNAGQMLFSVVAADSLWVVANFKETQLAKIKPGNTVEIVVDAFSEHPIKGIVTSFSKATGSKFSLLPPDNATGNFVKVVQRVPVKIIFADKAHLPARLSAGMSVQVAVNISAGSATDTSSNISTAAFGDRGDAYSLAPLKYK